MTNEPTKITDLRIGDSFELPIESQAGKTNIAFVVRALMHGERNNVIGVQASPLTSKSIKQEGFSSESFPLKDKELVQSLGINSLETAQINIGATTIQAADIEKGKVTKIGSAPRNNAIGRALLQSAPANIIPFNRFKRLQLPQQESVTSAKTEQTTKDTEKNKGTVPTDETTAQYDMTFENAIYLGIISEVHALRLSNSQYILDESTQVENGAIASGESPIGKMTSIRQFEKAVTGSKGPSSDRLKAIWGFATNDRLRNEAFREGMAAVNMINKAVAEERWNKGDLKGRVTGPAPEDTM